MTRSPYSLVVVAWMASAESCRVPSVLNLGLYIYVACMQVYARTRQWKQSLCVCIHKYCVRACVRAHVLVFWRIRVCCVGVDP